MHVVSSLVEEDKRRNGARSSSEARNGGDENAVTPAKPPPPPPPPHGRHHHHRLPPPPRSLASRLVTLLRTILLDLPLLLLFTLLVSAALIRQCYRGHVKTIVRSLRRSGKTDSQGFFPDFNGDFTYYNRHCDEDDITTQDANDLLIKEDFTSDQAADVMMKHGAIVLKDLLTQETAIELRKYLEKRHDIQADLPWHEKFFEEEDRLSLGLGIDDAPIIAEAVRQVGTHPTLRRALEGIVGPDPSVLEISTLTSMVGADDQGIHTDTDFFGSSQLYSRNFLHSYTMFIALQDTTAEMGATTLCPGTQWCADEDLERVCLEGERHAFEASSNGKTGKRGPNGEEGGTLLRGDAMMFNQNVWHRGAANHGPYNRCTFILTFVTRTKSPGGVAAGDVRYQGLGTYYYQRWNQWGHTYNDLSTASTTLSQPFGALRGLGLWKPSNRKWGITWIEHFAREYANREHFYADYELPAFTEFLEKVEESWGGMVPLKEWVWGEHYDERRPQWETFVERSMDNAVKVLTKVNEVAAGAYLMLHLAFVLVAWGFSRISSKKGGGKKTKIHMAPMFSPAFQLLKYYSIVALLGYAALKFVEHTELAQWASSGRAFVKPFPTPGSPAAVEAERALDPSSIQAGSGVGQGGGAGPATVPERMDVLLGSRFDAPYLASFDRTLDYHPGNVRFDELLDSFATLPSSLLNDDAAAKAILNLVQDRTVDGAQGITPRLLLQDYATGKWTVLPPRKAREEVRRRLLRKIDPKVEGAGRYLRQVLADSRFGRGRDTAKSRRFVPAFVERWERVIFGENSAGEANEDAAVAPLHPEVEASAARMTMKVEPLARVPPTSAASLRTLGALRKRRQATDSRVTPQLPPSVGAGDRVLADYGDRHGRLESVRVVKVYPSPVGIPLGDEALVIDADGNYDRLSVRRLRQYEPFVEGDHVEVLYFHDDEEYEDDDGAVWIPAEILDAHPLGRYDVRYDDDGTEEELVLPSRVRRPAESSSLPRLRADRPLAEGEEPTYVVGEFVSANYRGEGEWFDGQIRRVTNAAADGTYTYHVSYEDGDEEEDVPASRIRLQ